MSDERLRDPAAAARIAARIRRTVHGPLSLMEVCGTHTMAIAQFGIRGMLPPEVTLLSGPGCPVCVTALADIDRMIAIARQPGVVIATFGDMVRVPGSRSSLQRERAEGADIRVVYSPLDALQMSRDHPGKKVVFVGVGFETTSPTIAATVLEAERQAVQNFFVYPAFKLVPPALRLVLESRQAAVDGFILPGHVSAIIGTGPYRFIAEEFNKAGVVAGFEPLDILQAILLLAEQAGGAGAIRNEYRRGVPDEGNAGALKILYRVFEPCDAEWRAIGSIPQSGLRFKDVFGWFDARRQFPVDIEPAAADPACRCGQVMMGLERPDQCALYDTGCTPEHPVGPCMVSSEGSCAARHKYGPG